MQRGIFRKTLWVLGAISDWPISVQNILAARTFAMSNRTTVEFNHDFQGWFQDDISWPDALCEYMRSGDKDSFPVGEGISLIQTTMHYDPNLISHLKHQISVLEKDRDSWKETATEYAEKLYELGYSHG